MLAGVALYGCTSSRAEETKPIEQSPRHLEISFKFQRGGIASSQYAVWIENDSGKLIRTLYATSFTAKEGYEYRETSIPIWVKKARPQAMTTAQVDACTGATPQNGNLLYQWDGTDDNGERVSDGKYRFCIEGTLYWNSRVLYSGDFVWGGNAQNSIPVSVEYFNRSSTNQNMISGVKACVKIIEHHV